MANIKVISAEAFYNSKAEELRSDKEDMPSWMIDAAIEFAKLHVKAALEAAYSKHELDYVHKDPTGGDAKKLVKKSIINAYPETNIV